MTKNIVLTGFMGTGKTAVGKCLAEKLGYEFVDTDVIIEARDGRTIPQIFTESGEAAFRALEREVALELAHQEEMVISTGGGLMLDPVNAAVLEQNGRVFCLTASPAEILARLSREGGGERPLLAVSNPAGRIAALLADRQERYAQFEQIVTDGLSITEVVGIIHSKIIR